MSNKMNRCFFLVVVNCLNIFELCSSLPYDFCVPTLNISDCGMEPTPVFTYYKPGSRCEIELWRGCPTLNKFTNEFECSHYCIGKLNPSFSAEANGISDEHKQHQCEIPIDLDDCSGDETEVYTFNVHTETCEKVIWKGCDTVNKFDDEESCQDACRDFHQQEEDYVATNEENHEASSGSTEDSAAAAQGLLEHEEETMEAVGEPTSKPVKYDTGSAEEIMNV